MSRSGMATMAAITRFDNGPAAATHASPRRPPWRFMGFTGVGFAYPKKNVPCVRMAEITSIRPPTGSKWTLGFSVRRPCQRAVESPRRYAANAWQNSWTGKPTSSMMPTASSA